MNLLVCAPCAGSSTPASTAISAPRLLIHLAKRSSLTLSEEYTSLTCVQRAAEVSLTAGAVSSSGRESSADAPPAYFCCSVAEVCLENGARAAHGYSCREAQGAAHFKATLVEQVRA